MKQTYLIQTAMNHNDGHFHKRNSPELLLNMRPNAPRKCIVLELLIRISYYLMLHHSKRVRTNKCLGKKTIHSLRILGYFP